MSAVTADGIINAAERLAGVNITGSTDAGANGRVTVTVAGNSYRVTPGNDGTWTYKLTDADFSALGQGTGKTIVAAATDAAGNTGATTAATFDVDTVAPTLSPLSLLAGSDSGTKGDGVSNVATPQFSFATEAGLTYEGKVGSGAFVPLMAVQDGNAFKVAVPAGALTEGLNTITLRAKDVAGNAVERSVSYVLDTSAPALTVSSDQPSATVANIASGGILYTFTFDQPVTGFTAEDVVVTGGTRGTFSGVSSTVYTLEVNPTPGLEGALAVGVAANAAQDPAGNGSAAAQASSQAYDLRSPPVANPENR